MLVGPWAVKWSVLVLLVRGDRLLITLSLSGLFPGWCGVDLACWSSSVDRWGVCVCWSRSMVSLVRWCGLARLVVVGLVDDVPCGGNGLCFAYPFKMDYASRTHPRGVIYSYGLFVWVLVCALVWLVFLHGHVLVGLC